ncbi:hypothetical protein BDV93DRAFT_525582 [Ceratobasidium sp. AG-I]|nr:hypothetical protein BDV93DRAFT_525582 [Ceratobasidium sp. AG-I]
MLDAIPNIARWLEPESVVWGRGVDEKLGTSPLTPPSGRPPQISGHGLSSTTKRGFHTILKSEALIPSGSWHPDPILQQVGAMAQEVWRDTWLSCVPLLMEHNLSREEVRGILEGAMRELCDPSVQTVWKYTMVTCFKI